MLEQKTSEGMMERKEDILGNFKLRQLAEKELDIADSKTELLSEVSPENMANQLHELQVHQIELKMQNDELRRIHKELEKSCNKYSHLYDFAPVGYFTITEKGIIDEANLTLAAMLGVTRTALIGQSFTIFILKEDQDIYYKHRQDLLETQADQSCELRLVKKGKDTFYARLECVILKCKEHDLKQIRVAVSDITERKQIEDELFKYHHHLEDIVNERTAKLKESNQLLQAEITERKLVEAEKADLQAWNLQLQKTESLCRMAGAIAHNFNNQLSVVMGNLQLFMYDLPMDAKNRDNLIQSMTAAHKAAAVSQQMLTYLGLISNKKEAINLSETCRQSLSLLQVAIPKGMILNVDFPDSGPVIRAEAGQIQQIMTNLITNAWESISDNQGSIGLTIKTVSYKDIPASCCIPIDWQLQHIPHACLEVSDTGCGIPSMDIKKLFDPFFTTKFTGRGMGLSVVRGIVKAHDGCIAVDSKPGCGSVFQIYLPISTEKISCQQEKLAIPARKVEKNNTVLLVEDEEMVRSMTRDMLTHLGYSVLEAEDGVEAVEIFKQHKNKICCVLSDLTMPRMNGWETLTELRRMWDDVPVIIVSGYDKKKVMAGDHPELPQVFLHKPYQVDELEEALKKAFSA
ncbi:MAG: ATP-binding protein [Pseudomonadota bacterium]